LKKQTQRKFFVNWQFFRQKKNAHQNAACQRDCIDKALSLNAKYHRAPFGLLFFLAVL